MKNYTRTLILFSVAVSLLLVAMLAGCRQSCQVQKAEQKTWLDADGRVTVGGCVVTPVEAKR